MCDNDQLYSDVCTNIVQMEHPMFVAVYVNLHTGGRMLFYFVCRAYLI